MVATLDAMTLDETLDDLPSPRATQSELRCCACGSPSSLFLLRGFLPSPTRRFKRRNER
ncbi:MAG: hypothetical protein ACJAZN_000966 [Planctomycetota bacterium]|jgi:hypothetical protein